MKTDLKIRNIIDSKDGQHLSIYLPRCAREGTKNQLEDSLAEARRFLATSMNPSEIELFLEPLERLKDNESLMRDTHGTLGIFRNERSFQAISIPIVSEKSCILSQTFHVKPLLNWIQKDRNFFLIGVDERSVSLYSCSLFGLSRLGSFDLAKGKKIEGKASLRTPTINRRRSLRGRKLAVSLLQASHWCQEICQSQTNSMVFVAGKKKLAEVFLNSFSIPKQRIKNLNRPFKKQDDLELIDQARQYLRNSVEKEYHSKMAEFYREHQKARSESNLFQVARAAVAGRIKKLLISSDSHVFGKIDPSNGALQLHFEHMDHEDDDILDDIAQTVLAFGGEAYVTDKKSMPNGENVIALLHPNRSKDRLSLAERQRIYGENVASRASAQAKAMLS